MTPQTHYPYPGKKVVVWSSGAAELFSLFLKAHAWLASGVVSTPLLRVLRSIGEGFVARRIKTSKLITDTYTDSVDHNYW